ncbi:Tellurium resistance [Streptomyces sp. NBC_00433]
MAWWDFFRPSGAGQFDVANAHTVELTKRHPVVSLTKNGAAVGNMRVNLSWSMRTSDTGGWHSSDQRGFLRRQFDVFRPQVVQAAGPAMVNVDLDLACMYELTDGSKGVVQPLGNFLGDLDAPPYIQMSGDDRFGGTSGETLYINFDKRDEFKRLLVFVYIYDGTPAFDRTHAKVEIFPGSGPRIEIPLTEREPQARSCAVVLIENHKGELIVRREVKYIYGFQAEIDRLYGWGLQWGRGYKSKV